ncbi:MAG TPA: HAD-IB family phosphatase, partial [candidate division Zixibacteria bacterium]|nr:HAD-IB family phosphatase [candidate division Zixibacteria bacterium]
VNVIRHPVNKGKGAAIKTGIANAQGEIILFLDADLYSISPKKIASMLQPLEADEADFVKASFTRARGRVTELVVKPLLNVILPFIKLNQPLSGQFAIKKDLAAELTINDDWGVDMQILLQLVKKGVRIVEVDIGKLKHKKQPIENLTIMSEQIIKTVLSELGIIANKHKLVIFDLDKTLIEDSSIEMIAKNWSFEEELRQKRQEHEVGKVKGHELSLSLARFFKGRAENELFQILKNINPRNAAIGTIDRLKKRQYEIGIISEAFSPVVRYFAKLLGIVSENVISPILVTDRYGIFTGEVIARTKYNARCCDRIICKANESKELMKRLGVKPEECIAVADGKSDDCLFRACGLSLALDPIQLAGDIRISNLAEVLIYAE